MLEYGEFKGESSYSYDAEASEETDDDEVRDLGEEGSDADSSASKSNKISLLRLVKHKSFSTGSILSSSARSWVIDFDFFVVVCCKCSSLSGSDFRFRETASICAALLVLSRRTSFAFTVGVRTRQDLRVIKAELVVAGEVKRIEGVK